MCVRVHAAPVALLLAAAPGGAAAACCYDQFGGDACSTCPRNCAAAGSWCDAQAQCGGCGGVWCAPANASLPPPAALPGLSSTPLPAELVRVMRVGINLGNTLDAPTEGEWAAAAQESYFDAFKAKGFRHVRVPVRWDQHTAQSAPYTISECFFSRVEQVVAWSMARGLVTVINSHHDDWLDDEAAFDSQLPRFRAIWEQVAARFAAHGATLLFEVFNEPHVMSAAQLNKMNAAVLPIIRKTNPTRVVLFGGLQWMSPDWILANPDALAFPANTTDPYVMLEVHNYDPSTYTFDNPTTPSWGTDADKAATRAWMAGLQQWAARRGISVLYGEFGCTHAQTAATGRLDWYATHREAGLAAGFALCVWDDDAGFKLYDRAAATWDSGVLGALGL